MSEIITRIAREDYDEAEWAWLLGTSDQIVRCRDCKWCKPKGGVCICKLRAPLGFVVDARGYCDRGERR